MAASPSKLWSSLVLVSLGCTPISPPAHGCLRNRDCPFDQLCVDGTCNVSDAGGKHDGGDAGNDDGGALAQDGRAQPMLVEGGAGGQSGSPAMRAEAAGASGNANDAGAGKMAMVSDAGATSDELAAPLTPEAWDTYENSAWFRGLGTMRLANTGTYNNMTPPFSEQMYLIVTAQDSDRAGVQILVHLNSHDAQNEHKVEVGSMIITRCVGDCSNRKVCHPSSDPQQNVGGCPRHTLAKYPGGGTTAGNAAVCVSEQYKASTPPDGQFEGLTATATYSYDNESYTVSLNMDSTLRISKTCPGIE